MGRIVYALRVERCLELSAEDVCKQKERRTRRQTCEISPGITGSELRFIKHLLKCPVCGKEPHYLKIACKSPTGYEYKLDCQIHPGYYLSCGDWFDTPSKAGFDWNKRVRAVKEASK